MNQDDRDLAEEKETMFKMMPIIDGKRTTTVFFLCESLLTTVIAQSTDPKTAFVELARYYFDMSKHYTPDGDFINREDANGERD